MRPTVYIATPRTTYPCLSPRRRAAPLPALLLGALALAMTVAACSATMEEMTHDGDGELTVEQRQGVTTVRRETERFRDIAVAQAAGYTNQYPAGCAQSAAGAQGFHYLNPALVDDKVELLRPELVMYEPRPDGTRELIGVDYVVPFDAWKSDAPPTLLGMPFMRNEPLGVWALHIWAWRANPSGTFAMWNPSASCAHAPAL